MLTVDFINSLGITAQGLKVVDSNKNTILSANIAGETENKVQIGGFEVASGDLHTAGKTIGNTDSLFLSSTGITNSSGIGGSSGDQTWSITAGNNFGVTKNGKVYANDMVITAGDTDTIRIGAK